MKNLIEHIATSLVDHAEQVNLRETVGENSTVYELTVGDGELGMIIGKQGRTIRAIRTIVSAVAAKDGRRVVLEVLD